MNTDAPIESLSPEPAGAVTSEHWLRQLTRSLDDHFLRILRDYPFLIPLGFIALIAELGYAILNIATLPMHLDVDLNAAWATGWVISTFLLVEAVFKSPFGALGDRIGRKPLMVVGPLWSGMCCLVMYYLKAPWQFILLHGLNGLGFAAFWPACFSTIADRVRRQDVTNAMSVFNLTYLLGIAFGPLAKSLVGSQDIRSQVIGAMVRHRVQAAQEAFAALHPHVNRMALHAHRMLDSTLIRLQVTGVVEKMDDYTLGQQAALHGLQNHHRFPFLMVAVLFFFTGLFAVFIAPARRKAQPDPAGDGGSPCVEHVQPTGNLLQQVAVGIRTIPWMMAIAFTIFMGVGFVTPCIEPYVLHVYHISEREFGILLLPVAVLIGILALPMGRLGDQWGTTRSIRVGMSACAIGIWLVALQPLAATLPGAPGFVNSEWLMVALMGVVGVGFVVANPAWMARVTQMAPKHLSGAVLGAASMAQGAGALLGNLAGGYVWAVYQNTHPVAPMIGCAVMLGIGTLISLWHVRADPEARVEEA